jgi:hypothetical protein
MIEEDNIVNDSSQPVSSSRPEISRLQDAVNIDGSRAFEVNDVIVIEGNVKKGQWLDTRHYRVVSINDDNGEVKLYDIAYKQSAYTNYKIAPQKYGDVLKLSNRKLKT